MAHNRKEEAFLIANDESENGMIEIIYFMIIMMFYQLNDILNYVKKKFKKNFLYQMMKRKLMIF